MDNEEIQRVMNFIIERQEAFADNMEAARADTQQLKQTVTQLSETVGQLSETVGQLSETVGQLSQTVSHLSNIVGEVVDAQHGFLQSQERMQNDISNMLKITTGLFEIVVKNGGTPPDEMPPRP